MKVTFKSRRGGRKKLQPYQVRLVADFINFCAEKFIDPKILYKLEIQVVLDGKFYENEKCYGQATWLDRPRSPRKFLLDVDTRSKFVFILNTVSHEMVHVKQWANGELYDHFDSSVHTFKGKQYKLEDDDWETYWEVPWELEAYGRSIGLMHLWVMDRGYAKENWYSDKIWETEQRVEAIDRPNKK